MLNDRSHPATGCVVGVGLSPTARLPGSLPSQEGPNKRVRAWGHGQLAQILHFVAGTAIKAACDAFHVILHCIDG